MKSIAGAHGRVFLLVLSGRDLPGKLEAGRRGHHLTALKLAARSSECAGVPRDNGHVFYVF